MALCSPRQCNRHDLPFQEQRLSGIARRADIIVAAIGKAALVTPDFVRPGATVIDVGQIMVKDAAEAEQIFAKFPAKLESFRAKGSIFRVTFIRKSSKLRERTHPCREASVRSPLPC